MVALLAGCSVGEPEPDSLTTGGDDRRDCSASSAVVPDALRRLTMTQYTNSVRDIVRLALGDGPDAESVIARAALEDLPLGRREPLPQDIHGSYRRLDQSLDQVHIDSTFRVAAAVASAPTGPERLGRVVGNWAADSDIQATACCPSLSTTRTLPHATFRSRAVHCLFCVTHL